MKREPVTLARLMLLCMSTAATGACYSVLPSSGGGETTFSPPRAVHAEDVALVPGYTIEVVATGLTFPTGVAFDDRGRPYVVESGYAYGEVWTVPRLLRVDSGGSVVEITRGGRNGPWNGVAWGNGAFVIAEGGVLEGGRILQVTMDGAISSLIDGLPSRGDHHTNGPAVGPDGKIYFGQGTATNSAVVGEDSAEFGWLARFPEFHDTPCEDITLSGENFETPGLLQEGESGRVSTGAYSPFGTETRPGQQIDGQVPCNGAVLRMDADGTGLELVAWGFRNPYGLAFAPDGNLYVTDNAYDVRGSRPIWGTGDYLWRVTAGAWYGWPDFAGGRPVDAGRFQPPGGETPRRLLDPAPNEPPPPAAILGVHASANGLDFSRSERFGHVGQAFVAEFGDMSPDTGKSLHPVGFRVVRVDVDSGQVEDFAVNRGPRSGPASKLKTAGLERPIAARFSPSGDELYVVDFGVMLMEAGGPTPKEGTGVLWKISRQ